MCEVSTFTVWIHSGAEQNEIFRAKTDHNKGLIPHKKYSAVYLLGEWEYLLLGDK